MSEEVLASNDGFSLPFCAYSGEVHWNCLDPPACVLTIFRR
jgi:hypothetical protein